MTDSSTAVANSAIQLIGDNAPPVTGISPTFDNSPAGKALQILYVPAVRTVAREFGWDFERNTVALTLSGNVAPFPWTFEYLYPTNGVEVWQLMPATLADPNDPLPTNWVIANNIVSAVQKKVIQTDFAGALAVFANQPTEDTWDPIFREAVVRLLASELAMALEGKPDTERNMLETSDKFAQLGTTRNG